MIDQISVIIPVYNRSQYLDEAIRSVLKEETAEIIVIDDGSEASFSSEIEKLCSHYELVKLLRLENNSGVSAARNFGVSHASGSLICFLDDDDKISEDHFQRSKDAFQRNEKVDVVISRSQLFSSSGKVDRRRTSYYSALSDKYHHRPIEDPGYFLMYTPAIHACVFRKSVFGQVKFEESLSYGEDRALLLTVRRSEFRFFKGNWTGALYRQDEPNSVLLEAHSRYYEWLLKFYDKPSIQVKRHLRLYRLYYYVKARKVAKAVFHLWVLFRYPIEALSFFRARFL